MKAQLKILRSDPKAAGKPRYVTYAVPFSSGDKVLGGLLYIYRNIDPCLSFRFNCKARHCGECSMMINGKPGLSCEVSMTREVTVEPLRNLPLIKDLVIDRNGVYRGALKHLPKVEHRNDHPEELSSVSMELVDRIVRLDDCIHCLCCMSVCPVYKKDPALFPGPLGLLLLATNMENMPGIDGPGKASLCIDCGICEKVCPRKIPIFSEAITRLRRS
jgi:succinate dehydrogenase/fumarate reductase iron-sulfur protein